MNKHHKRRILVIILFVIISSIAAGLILFAFKQNINVFLTPADITSQHINSQQHFRLGGLVKPGSLIQNKKTLQRHFIVTDLQKEVRVFYLGSLPDLFREGKGVVLTGQFKPDGEFNATQVLAKHDENYMPPKVARALQPKVIT